MQTCTITNSTGGGPYFVSFSQTSLNGVVSINADITNAPVGATIKCGASNNPSTTDGYGRWVSPDGTFSLLATTVSNPVPLVTEAGQTVVAEGTVVAGGTVTVQMAVYTFTGLGSLAFKVTCMVKVADPDTCSGVPSVYDVNVQRICFPADATVNRIEPSSKAKVSTRMDELKIGDTIECLKPQYDAANFAGETGYLFSTCQVFYYLNANSGNTMFVYQHLSYTDTNGDTKALRISPQHNVFIPKTALTSPASAPPLGSYKTAEQVVVGDLLAPQDPATGEFYTTAVTKVESIFNVGAYTPLVMDAGLIIVDNVVAWTTSGSYTTKPFKQERQHWTHIPIWQAVRASSTNCLDTNVNCAKIGKTLSDLDDGLAPYFNAYTDVQNAAAAQGRTKLDLAGFIGELSAGDNAGIVYTQTTALAVLDKYLTA